MRILFFTTQHITTHFRQLLLLLLVWAPVVVIAQTTADFTISKTSGCVPLSGVNFTDISTGGTVIKRSWDLGNGTIIPNGVSPTGTNYLTDGTFTIKLTVTFSNGDVRTAQKQVVVHPRPEAGFSATLAQGCAPLTASFNDLSVTKTGTITSYIWDLGAGGSSQPTPTFTYTQNGSYNISLLVKNSWGCESEALTQTNYIRVFPKPVAGFTIPANASCQVPFTPSFVNTTTGDGTITYSWDFGNGESSSEKDPATTYTLPGVYRVKLTAQNGPGCTSTYTAPTEIYAGTPEVQINSPATACANTAVPFSAQILPASFGYNYKWTFSDNGSVRTGKNPSYTFTSPGTYKVTLEAANQAGCSETSEHFITIRPTPQAAFSADKTTSCKQPFAVKFTPSSVSPDVQYNWNFGDGTLSSNPEPLHTYNQVGYFTVSLEAKDISVPDGCAASVTKSTLIRISIPQVDFTYTPPGGCMPLPVTFTARVSNLTEPVAKYKWNFGDGNTAETTTPNYVYTYTSEGTFNARLTIETLTGCSEESILKPVSVVALCDDDGAGGGGGGGGAGFGVGKSCIDKYTVTFTNTHPDTEIISWDFGDGSPLYTTFPLSPVVHTFPNTAKQYVVTIVRRNLLTNQIYTAQKRVLIIDEKADFKPNLTDICAGKTVNFTTQNINASAIKTYSWDFGDGSPLLVINNEAYFNAYGTYLDGSTLHKYTDNGSYTVTLTITDKLGCSDESAYSVPIKVKGPEAAFSASDLTSCNKDFDVRFTDASVPNGTTKITSWKWSFGDGTSVTMSDNTQQQHSYSNQSYYREFAVNLLITDEIGCESSVSHTVKSYRPQAAFSSSDVLTCGKKTITFSNNSSARNATYKWEYGDGTTANGYAPNHTYLSDGAYTIQLTVTDENGCKASDKKAEYIKLVKPEANFTIADSNKCAPVALILGDSSTYASSYSWDFGDGGTGTTDKNPAPHIYALPGLYNITLRVKGVGGCESTITKQVKIKGPIGALDLGPTTGCAPFTLDMRVRGTNISTYSWDMGDGTPVNPSETADEIRHIYPDYGKYLPNVILSSPEGCQYTLKVKDPVIVDDAQASFETDKNNFCDTGVVKLTNTSFFPFGNPGTFRWEFGDGEISTDKDPEPHIYKQPGTYTIKLIAKSINNCRSEFKLVQPIHVARPPELNIPGDMEQCAELSRRFEAGILSEDQVTGYNWLLNEVPVGTNAPLEKRFDLAGTYELALAVQTKYGCFDTLKQQYTVHPLPFPAAAPDTVICTGTGLTLRANDGVRYEWSPATGISNPLQAKTQAFPVIDTRYTVRVENKFGCVKTESIDVKVDKRVELKKNSDAIICLGERVRLFASGNASHFTWSPPAGLSDPGVARPYAAPISTTTYQVTGHSANVCPDETASVKVTVGSIPTVDLGADRVLMAGVRVTLTPAVSNDVISYEWSPSADLSCSTCPAPQFSADKATTYRLRVKTQYGCTATDEIRVKVLCGTEAVYIPNAFTPNGDGHNDVFFIKGFGIRSIRRLQVFDRWGNVVYSISNVSPNDASRGWNGDVKGKVPPSTATFVYMAEVECHEGNTFMLKGTVTLIR